MTTPTFLQGPVVFSLKIADIVEDVWPILHDCLPPDERCRADAFHHGADRQSFIAAHALLRLSLIRILGPHPAAFVANAYGKPCFAADHPCADIGFNISHSRGMVAVGIARGAAIGVDTEPLDRLDQRDMAVITRWLSPVEQSRVAACGEAERAACLLDLWTLKEAVIKATGQGLSLELASFSIDPDRLSVTGLAGTWQLARWIHDAHRIAGAVCGTALSLNHSRVVICQKAAGLEVIVKS